MPLDIPLLAPSGQSPGLFPGRDRGTPADTSYAAGSVSMSDDGGQVNFDAGRAHISVPVIILGALLGLILLHAGGFRFAFDVSVGKR